MRSFVPSALAVGLLAMLVIGPPAALAASDIVYIPLGSEGQIVVVDVERDRVVRRIQGLPAVHGLAGTSDGRLLIAGSFEERDSNGAAPSKPAGVSEVEHAAHHAAPAPGADQAGSVLSTVSIVRAADGAIVRRIDVPGAVHHVAVSPSGQVAVVTHPNQGTISAIDLERYKVLATVPTGSLPNYATFNPDGTSVYVSNAGDDTVSEVDTAKWTLRRNVIVGASPEHIVLGSNGKRLYVNNVDAGTVSVLDVGSGTVEKTIPIGATLHGIDLSDDGRMLYVAALGDDKLVAVDLKTGTYRSAVLSPSPYHLAMVRGTGKLYVSSAERQDLWIVDQEKLGVLGQIPIGGKGHQMVLAPGIQ